MASKIPWQLIIKLNGEEGEKVLSVYGEELETVDQLIDLIRTKLHCLKTPQSKVYSFSGVCLQNDDILYIRDSETLYYDAKGKEFDTRQIIDQYQKEELLGQGGFGSVYRARHKETGQNIALKYIDLSEFSKRKR